MKKTIIFGSLFIVSLFVMSCGSSSSCTSVEEDSHDNLTAVDHSELLAQMDLIFPDRIQ